MALEFNDWGLTPEEKVASRKKALDAYTNIAYPMETERQGMEKGQLASDVYQSVAQAARAGDTQAIPSVLAKAQQQAASLIPQQGERQQELAYKGAQQREDILGAKQSAAVGDYERNTQEYKDKSATLLANKAFEMGYSSKELALSMNGYLADKGLQQMYKDLQAGRVTATELRDMGNKLQYQAEQMRADLQKDLQKIKGDLQILIANKDFEAAKKRIADLTAKMKDAAEVTAKGTWIGSVVSGVTGIAGGLVAGAVSGGNPLAIKAGYSTGKDIGTGITSTIQ